MMSRDFCFETEGGKCYSKAYLTVLLYVFEVTNINVYKVSDCVVSVNKRIMYHKKVEVFLGCLPPPLCCFPKSMEAPLDTQEDIFRWAWGTVVGGGRTLLPG